MGGLVSEGGESFNPDEIDHDESDRDSQENGQEQEQED